MDQLNQIGIILGGGGSSNSYNCSATFVAKTISFLETMGNITKQNVFKNR